MTLSDAELESRMTDLWHRFRSAVQRDDDEEGKRFWDELFGLHLDRTPQQRARALLLAGYNEDGTPIERAIEARV